MDIVGLNQVSSRGGQIESTQDATMGKNDFLQLLVAQLQAQDPLNPMDPTGFTAQLAQFSSLEQLQNANGALDDIFTSQSILTNSQAIGFIGKTISALGNSINVENGEISPLEMELGSDAAAVYISIYDAQGVFVKDLTVGALAAGRHEIDWDGMDYSGNQVLDGSYYFEVSAVDELENDIPTVSYSSGIVTGVNFKNGHAYLMIGDQEVAMGNVVEVLSMDESEQ